MAQNHHKFLSIRYLRCYTANCSQAAKKFDHGFRGWHGVGDMSLPTELEGISGGRLLYTCRCGAGPGRTRVGTGARTASTRRVQGIPGIETECHPHPSLRDVAFQIRAALDSKSALRGGGAGILPIGRNSQFPTTCKNAKGARTFLSASAALASPGRTGMSALR